MGRGRASRACATTSPATSPTRRARSPRRSCAILDAARDVERAPGAAPAPPRSAPAREDVERQLRRLVHPGFVTATGAARLPDVERYLRAAARRLERLPDAPAPDLDRMAAIQELEREYGARARDLAAPAARAGRPARDPWLLEELRVSHFAQALGTRGQVSAKRIRKVDPATA